MKKILLFSFLFLFSLRSSLFEKIKTAPSAINGIRIKYFSPSAVKNFYQLPRNNKLNLIKNNPIKTILYTYAAASSIHTTAIIVDTSLKEKSPITIFFTFVIAYENFKELKNLIRGCDVEYYKTTTENDAFSRYEYYYFPTLAYSHKFFEFITSLIEFKKNRKNE